MAFQNAHDTDASYSIFSENRPGSSTQTVVVTNDINSDGPRAASARFDSNNRQGCLEGTRKDILEEVDLWINIQATTITESEALDTQCIFWINGLAGSGKTTIAYTVAKRCMQRGILGATFFCSRDDANSNNPKLIFASIADQLGQFYAPFGERVALAHKADPGLRYSSVSNQLEELLVKPLRVVRDTFPFCLIILDALDECNDDNATSIILSSLSRHITTLAPLKFLVTSRPEQKISGGFRLAGLNRAAQHFNLHEVKLNVVEQDIEKYLTSCLKEVKEKWGLEDEWPTKDDVRALTSISSGLFIFAATAIKFIWDHDPRERLTQLLTTTTIEGSSPHQYLDQLYMQVLTNAFPDISGDLSSRLKKIMGTIALLQYPLYPSDIERLLHLGPGTIRKTTLHLSSVLTVPKGEDQMIRLIHPSFFDFLTDSRRCSNAHFALDSEMQHGLLARACLDAMKELKRDICCIGDPSKLNSEVDDLSERVSSFILPHLQYACRNWTYHLSHIPVSDFPLESFREFCSTFLLYWVEVCGLLGELRTALINLGVACRLVSQIKEDASDVLVLLRDCERFISAFFPALSVASLHTYYSALAFTPTETLLRKRYNHELEYSAKYSVKVHYGVKKQWDPCLLAIEDGSSVASISLSPDGDYVASGSANVKIYRAATGVRLQSSDSDNQPIFSVAFSPDGAYIISGCFDNSIRMWDIVTGAPTRIFKGHSSVVSSVTFSLDGVHIASGSGDGDVRIWDTHGTCLRTIKAHLDLICSVKFSPDGTRIASGSEDKTVRIWDATGVHLHTLKGHSSDVTSVAYSPDGSHIISGSLDKTIRIWDANGAHTKTLKGHSSAVLSVAYSPSGAYIISGSQDTTVRVWDTSGSNLKTLRGHSDDVTSVTCSSDGTRVISGSVDKTIRVWDGGVQVDAHQPGMLKDPFNWILAFSSIPRLSATTLWEYLNKVVYDVAICTTRIATHDYHTTIDLWDIEGKHISKLKGAIAMVTQMVFSRAGDHFAAVSADNTVRLWSGLDGTYRATLKGQGDWGLVGSPTFSSDGIHFAFGCGDTTVQLFGAVNGEHIKTFKGHTADVREIAFFPDGAYVVSGSDDKTVRIWDMKTGNEVHSLHNPHRRFRDLYVSADQKSIIMTTSSMAKKEKKRHKLAIPRKLWPKDGHNPSDFATLQLDQSMESADGWLYSENPRRRICWIPTHLRKEDTEAWAEVEGRWMVDAWSDHGCILSRNRKEKTILCISSS